MSRQLRDASPRLMARTAGFLYLIVLVVIGYAIYTRSTLIVSGDAAATARNILSAEQTFRYTFVADLVGAVCYVGVTLLLYELLKPVSRGFSRLAAVLSLIAIAIQAANMVNLIAPLVLLGDAPYLAALPPEQLQAMAQTSLRLHALGYHVSVVFFDFYMLLLAFLIIRARFLPAILGVLLGFESVCGLIYSFATFLAPAVAAKLYPAILAPGLLGEGSLTLWLFLVGVNAAKWREQAGAD